MENKQYWPAGDIIRVFGTLGVVFIHITELLLTNPIQLDAQWWLLNIVQTLCIWAVPGFIMLSGVLLVQPQKAEELPLKFYQKRLNRIGIPFLFWGGFYILFEHWYRSDSFVSLAKLAMSGNISSHMSFLFIISGLYIITPWLSKWISQLSANHKLMVCCGFFLLTAFSELVREFLIPWNWNALTCWLPFLDYYVAGHYIVFHALDRSKLFWFFLIGGGLLMSGGKYLEILHSSHRLDYFYSTNYSSVAMIFLSLGIFGVVASLTRSLSEESKFVQICRFFAPATFGIYLVHPIFIRGMRKLISVEFPNSFLTTLLDEVVVILVSLLIVYAIGAIPNLRSVVGLNTQALLARKQSISQHSLEINSLEISDA